VPRETDGPSDNCEPLTTQAQAVYATFMQCNFYATENVMQRLGDFSLHRPAGPDSRNGVTKIDLCVFTKHKHLSFEI
jgi:hypothetical protein